MHQSRALLIDDEEYARLHLRDMLAAAHPDVRIVGEASALPAARTLIARGGYDFIFLDVKLGPDTAFDLVPEVPPDKPIIFVTGYEHHARRAFEVNALDYIVKPVRASRLTESLNRLREFNRMAPPIRARISPPHVGLGRDGSVALEVNSRPRLVRVADIASILAQENYTLVRLVDGTAVMVRRSLKSWAASLPTDDFIRAHRNILVNINHVLSYHHELPRRITLRVAGVDGPVHASRFSTTELKARLRARFPN